MNQRSHRRADVVILTATQPELDAVLKVEAGAVAGSSWEEATGPSGLPVFYRRFNGKGSRPLRVAVAVAPDMGALAAANTLLPLIDALEPHCIAMCGVCAGRRGKVQLGDVIAADRPYYHDTGKQLPGRVEQDLTTYKLRDDWKVALERMDPVARFRGEHWFHERPLTTEWRLYRAMVALRDEVPEPWAAVDLAPGGADEWPLIVAALRKRKMLAASGRRLTRAGHRFVEDLLLRHRNALPDLAPTGKLHPFRLHVAPIGTGARVIEDEQIWTFVSQTMRKTLGIEMEAAVIGEVAHRQRHRELHWIVMKGVMDFADHGRDDHFKKFAARASAECLLWFLREHLATDPVAGFDDVLTPGTLALPPNPVPPSMLLAAPFTFVPWHQAGRDEVMAELDRWADDPSRAAAVRLLHAEGGVGKTRLAIEWLKRRRGEDGASDRHDIAGFLPPNPADGWLERLCALSAPVVITVDYAETRADLVAVLSRVAAARALKPERRIRVLLLARSDGDWWEELRQRDLGIKALLMGDEPIALTSLAASPVDRQVVFAEALKAFATRKQRPAPEATIEPSDQRFERVLYLQMAALAAVERSADLSRAAHGAVPRIVLKADALMSEVLDHEQRFWLRDRHDPLPALESLARQLVTAATLRGGLSKPEAGKLCERLMDRPRASAEDGLLAQLHQVYTSSDPSKYLPGLQPDLLGEAMVLRVADEQANTVWIERVIVQGDDAHAISTAFTVLERATVTNATLVHPWLDQLLRTDLPTRAVLALRVAKAVGLRTALSPLGDLLAAALNRDGSRAVALALAEEGLPYPTVSLRRVAEWYSRVQGAEAREGDEDQALAARAASLNDLGIRLSDVDQREAAVDATRQAVEAFRALVAKHPDAFLPAFAMSLTNLGSLLSEVGQREAALDTTRQAVVAYGALTARSPDAFLPDLANSLNNLGSVLNAIGLREAALDATRESVEAYRALAAKHADAFLPNLAAALNNLGNWLSAVGQRDAALDATREAVEIRRGLASTQPDAFLPSLATSLTNLGSLLGAVGQSKAALDVTREAVEAYRALTARHPDAFLSNLAMSLNNLGNRLSAIGQRKAALDATREAVESFRALAGKHPDAFLSTLAMSLNNLGNQLNAVGEREAGLDATREAVEAYRALVATHPDAFLSNLAIGLNNLGNQLNAVGKREAAFDATREAVEMFRALADKNPAAFLSDLAGSLNNLGNRLIGLGKSEAALDATREAVETFRALADKHPDAFLPDLASGLNNLGNLLSTVGQRDAAIGTTREAVEAFRTLAAEHPDAFLPDLVTSLNNLALRLTETGDHDAANAASREAAEIRRTLQAKNPPPDDEGGSA